MREKNRTFSFISIILIIIIASFAATTSRAAGVTRLGFEDRVDAERRIEEVYWRHRIWPAENAGAKPPLESVLPDSALRSRVDDELRQSAALEQLWSRPITPGQLQAELNRMASDTRDPELLRELFAALGNDPALVAETLARRTLVDTLVRSWYAADSRFHVSFDAWWCKAASTILPSVPDTPADYDYALPAITTGSCVQNTWTTTAWSPQPHRNHTAVWTGSEMIVWWGGDQDAGGRYDPATDTWRPVPAPATFTLLARTLHSAVWTGTEMIVWGGELGNQTATNTGGRYNPTTSTWSTISSGANAPSARWGHTVVWTGASMIVWGGSQDLNTVLNSGGIYNPATDTWSATTTTKAPTPRQGHTAVWTGSEMIVWGGGDNTGARYNPATNSWKAIRDSGPGVPEGRLNHVAVWSGTEMVVWGGISGTTSLPLNTGGRYDPAGNKWKTTSVGAGVPTARQSATAVWTGSQMVVWGGSSGAPTGTGGRYSPATDTWTATSTAGSPAARSAHTSVWSGTEMLVWGGNDGFADLGSGARYATASDSWVATAQIAPPAPRAGQAAVWTGSEMFVWGGSNGGLLLNTGGRYVPATNSWTSTSTVGAPSARSGMTAVWTGTEVIVWGGSTFGINAVLNSGGRYNPTTDAWVPTSLAGVPSQRAAHTAVWTGSEMIVWGGTNGPSVVNSGGRYAPATDSWTPTSTGANVPSARQLAAAVWTGSAMIVWGGTDGSIDPITGGRYDPTTDFWGSTSTANAPTGRFYFASVWSGTEMIVWGGTTSSLNSLSSGGRYNPLSDSWAPTSGVGAPSARYLPTGVWTGGAMIVWGGLSASGGVDLGDGGAYDPSVDSWSAVGSAGQPPEARQEHTAVWTGSEMIVWGGRPFTDTGARYCVNPM